MTDEKIALPIGGSGACWQYVIACLRSRIITHAYHHSAHDYGSHHHSAKSNAVAHTHAHRRTGVRRQTGTFYWG